MCGNVVRRVAGYQRVDHAVVHGSDQRVLFLRPVDTQDLNAIAYFDNHFISHALSSKSGNENSPPSHQEHQVTQRKTKRSEIPGGFASSWFLLR